MLSNVSLKRSDNKIRVFTVKITPSPVEDKEKDDVSEHHQWFNFVSEALVPV